MARGVLNFNLKNFWWSIFSALKFSELSEPELEVLEVEEESWSGIPTG
jgi:hypothetical protein